MGNNIKELSNLEMTPEQLESYIKGFKSRMEKRDKEFKENYERSKWTKDNDNFEYNL